MATSHTAAAGRHGGEKDYYAILDVSPSSTQEVIKKSYQKLLRLHHPDKTQGGGADASHGHCVNDIIEAWSVLGSDTERRRYDALLLSAETFEHFNVWREARVEEFDVAEGDTLVLTCRCGGEFRLTKAEVEQRDVDVIDCDTCSLTVRVRHPDVSKESPPNGDGCRR